MFVSATAYLVYYSSLLESFFMIKLTKKWNLKNDTTIFQIAYQIIYLVVLEKFAQLILYSLVTMKRILIILTKHKFQKMKTTLFGIILPISIKTIEDFLVQKILGNYQVISYRRQIRQVYLIKLHWLQQYFVIQFFS